MNREEFNKHVDQLLDGCKSILGTKGEDYSYADTDRLSNFKETAKEIEQSKYTIWYVYFNKGMSAIRRYIYKGAVESENIHARIKDAINYLILLDALITEDEQIELKIREDDKQEERIPCDKTYDENRLTNKYVHNEVVSKQGITCTVTSIFFSNKHNGYLYGLKAQETGTVFKDVKEEDIKQIRFQPPIT